MSFGYETDVEYSNARLIVTVFTYLTLMKLCLLIFETVRTFLFISVAINFPHSRFYFLG